jgi:hypothetical protein
MLPLGGCWLAGAAAGGPGGALAAAAAAAARASPRLLRALLPARARPGPLAPAAAAAAAARGHVTDATGGEGAAEREDPATRVRKSIKVRRDGARPHALSHAPPHGPPHGAHRAWKTGGLRRAHGTAERSGGPPAPRMRALAARMRARHPSSAPADCPAHATPPPPTRPAPLPPRRRLLSLQTSSPPNPQDWASLPWDLSMPYEEAAKVLGAWAGPSTAGMAPGTVLPLDQAQMTELLAETTTRGNTRLEAALFAHADSVTRAFFGDDVYCEPLLGWGPDGGGGRAGRDWYGGAAAARSAAAV